MEFSKRLDLFGDEIFAALNERKVALEAQGRTIYNLSVGTPDFAPAEHIRKAMMDAAADPQNWKYSLRDLPELLDAVCGYYKRRFGVEITPDQVASCAGSQEGVGHIGMVLCDEGDTVLLPTPCYPVFIAGSLLGGAQTEFVRTFPNTNLMANLCAVPYLKATLQPGTHILVDAFYARPADADARGGFAVKPFAAGKGDAIEISCADGRTIRIDLEG